MGCGPGVAGCGATRVTRFVVQFTDSQEFGGAENSLLLLMSGLGGRGWRTMLLHHDQPGLEALVRGASRLGISCQTVPRLRGPLVGAHLQRTIRLLRAERPAIFHAHLTWPLACSPGLLAATLARVPAIVATVQLAGTLPTGLAIPFLRRFAPRLVDRYVAVSDAVAEQLPDLIGVDGSKIRVVHNGIDVAAHVARARRDGALRRQGSTVLTTARLERRKGHRYLLEAASLVPGVRFLLAGDGPERSELEEKIQRAGLGDRVMLLGYREDIPKLLECCDVFAFPSLDEGLPLAVLEAMAARRPVVASAIPSIAEVITHGQTGLLVPPGDPVALAQAIQSLLEDSALVDRLTVAARQRVERSFTVDAMARGVCSVYEELVREGLDASHHAKSLNDK
jgi:glycosyltransferase involved in cell wall biosynthesis